MKQKFIRSMDKSETSVFIKAFHSAIFRNGVMVTFNFYSIVRITNYFRAKKLICQLFPCQRS